MQPELPGDSCPPHHYCLRVPPRLSQDRQDCWAWDQGLRRAGAGPRWPCSPRCTCRAPDPRVIRATASAMTSLSAVATSAPFSRRFDHSQRAGTALSAPPPDTRSILSVWGRDPRWEPESRSGNAVSRQPASGTVTAGGRARPVDCGFLLTNVQRRIDFWPPDSVITAIMCVKPQACPATSLHTVPSPHHPPQAGAKSRGVRSGRLPPAAPPLPLPGPGQATFSLGWGRERPSCVPPSGGSLQPNCPGLEGRRVVPVKNPMAGVRSSAWGWVAPDIQGHLPRGASFLEFKDWATSESRGFTKPAVPPGPACTLRPPLCVAEPGPLLG